MLSYKTKFYFILSIFLAISVQTNSQANIFKDFRLKKRNSFPKFKLTECKRNSKDIYIQKLYSFNATLCNKLKLKQPTIYIFKTKKHNREYNAFAMNCIAFGNLLLERWREGWILDQEIEAIMAHELSHLKCNHPIKLGMLNLALSGPLLISLISLPFPSPRDLTINAYSRKNEKEADMKAIKSIDDPMSLLTGLVKLYCLNYKKPKTKEAFDTGCNIAIDELVKERKSFISPVVELLSTHPLTSKRMAYIKKHAHAK